jgi:mRNA-degrading endonuclease RelE of RelBE toxin-antitoxin system
MQIALARVYPTAYILEAGTMNEHCEIRFTSAAAKEMLGVAKRDPKRASILRELVAQVEENGWKLSTNSQAIKVLREETCVGEIRDVGSGGYRLFMFWHDKEHVRELWICRVLPKRDVEGKRRLSDICDAVEELRRRFIEEDE